MTFADRRKLERFELKIPVFLIFDKKEKNEPIVRQTRDVSSKGAFIYSDTPVPVGTHFYVDLILSKHSHVKVDGSVVRSEQSGIAVYFDKNYQIIPENA